LGSGAPAGFSEGAVLGPGPIVLAGAAGLGIVPTGTGPFPATYSEMDGMSYGVDAVSPFTPFGLEEVDPLDGHNFVHRWNFSVDEFAGGDPASPIPPGGPSVFTEGALGAVEASADVFVAPLPASFGPGAGPFPAPPFTFIPGINVQVLDGDGSTAPPLGLVEPNPPTPFMGPFSATPDPGDNVDAIDVDTFAPAPLPPGTPVFFTMDTGAFSDPIENPVGAPTPAGFAGPNFGTALANGFSGSDIVVSPAGLGGPIALFAPAGALGLDSLGFDTDDIDALIIADMGPTPGVYDPVAGPYSWLGGGTDMVLFSLRRGSATIGMPDGLTGTPIEEGDILLAGAAGILPGIFVAAEDLGLGTIRSGTATFVDSFGVTWADDLDAADVEQQKRGDVDGDFDVDADDIDAMAALATAPVGPFGAPFVADMNFDLFADTAFNTGGGGLVSDTDWLIREILGTEYGDANLDGRVDILDFDLLGQGIQGLGTGWFFGDFNGSGTINFADLLVLLTNYGFAAPGAGSGAFDGRIPEPTTGGLACLALVIACFGCRVAHIRCRGAKPVARLLVALLFMAALAQSSFAVEVAVISDPLGRASTSIDVAQSPEPGFLTYTFSVEPLMPLTEITTIEAAFTASSMRQVNPFGAPTIFTNNNFLFPFVGEDPLSDSQFEFNSGGILTAFQGEGSTSLSATFTNFPPIAALQPIAHAVLPAGIEGTIDMTLVVRATGVPGEGLPAEFSGASFGDILPGDFNDDGTVDAADYIVWRRNFGAAAGTLPNDIDGGSIGVLQYDTWRAYFGATDPTPGAGAGGGAGRLLGVSVPEPSTWVGWLWLVMIGVRCWDWSRVRHS
jgi:hypothetical protein